MAAETVVTLDSVQPGLQSTSKTVATSSSVQSSLQPTSKTVVTSSSVQPSLQPTPKTVVTSSSVQPSLQSTSKTVVTSSSVQPSLQPVSKTVATSSSVQPSLQPTSKLTTSNPKVVQKELVAVDTTVGNTKADPETSDLKPPPLKKPALETRYGEFLKLIGEVGKDIKPAYTNGKGHSDRLRKNIGTARSILRECLGELDRISRSELQPKTVAADL